MPPIEPLVAIADLEARLSARLQILLQAQAGERLQRQQGTPPDWIVVSGFDLPLAFDLGDNGQLLNPRSTHAHLARRFATREAAEAVATRIRDGHDRQGRAVTVETALAADIHGLHSLLATVAEHLAANRPDDGLNTKA